MTNFSDYDVAAKHEQLHYLLGSLYTVLINEDKRIAIVAVLLLPGLTCTFVGIDSSFRFGTHMEKIYSILKNNHLWRDIAFGEFKSMIDCMDARRRNYKKGDFIVMAGDTVTHIGLIISGSVKIFREDYDGNAILMTELGSSDLFGEVFACAGIDHSPVSVQASESVDVMYINFRKVLTTCSSACSFHTKLIENMLQLIAKKSLLLNEKIEILSKRSTREKLLAFLEMHRNDSGKFTIPYNREEMALYLCVDRSAMSSELSKMRDDGLILYKKNEFEIL